MIKFLKRKLRPYRSRIKIVFNQLGLNYLDSMSFSESDLIYRFYRKKAGKVMIDVGVHHGESFYDYESMGWTIFGFEPDPSNRVKVKIGGKKTFLHDLAVSDVDDLELRFYTSDESSGVSGLVPFLESHQSSFTVKTITLETFLKEKKLEYVSYLKIDTEGNDLLVLKGYPFVDLSPQIIMCEFEDKKTQHLGYTYKDMGEFLVNKGYKVLISEWYPITKYGGQHKWRVISEFNKDFRLSDNMAWGNFLAIKEVDYPLFKKVMDRYLKNLTN